MAHRIPFAALAFALALPGCVTMQQVVRDDGNARIGEPTRAGPLIVRPTDIVEDSRCPVDARCIWAGRLIVRTNISVDHQRETRDLTLGEPLAIAGGMLVLDSGEPGKRAGQDTPSADYRLHFSFADAAPN